MDSQFKSPHEWMNKLKYYFKSGLDTASDYTTGGDETTSDRANLVSSRDANGLNYLFLDIDDERVYIKESSTKGHYHIAFPFPIPDAAYNTLVGILYDYGIIAYGNMAQHSNSGAFYFRVPWIKKGQSDRLEAAGEIGPRSFSSDEEALQTVIKGLSYLGIDIPKEVFQQMNAREAAKTEMKTSWKDLF